MNAAPRVTVSRSHTPPCVEEFAKPIGAEELVPFGGAGNKIGRLLTGQADVYAHKVGLKEWDTCAPETIARAAGWHVRKVDGSEHRYNLAAPHNHAYVMCRPAWTDRVIAALASSGVE